MSLLNKYMHPRNIYRTPPNFKELAIMYPDFRNFVKQDITGKVSIDFKDQDALRALTITLMKKDFNLDVDILQGRLVPTLPLRLNYLLWIEDLLACTNTDQSSQIYGVDIGTGVMGIYSLLAAKLYKWKMLATEVDTKNIDSTNFNIERNNLQHLITVLQVNSGTILSGVINDEQSYDFCMCNPPFFSNEQELEVAVKSRSKTRPAPHNAQTGAIEEMVVPGGEVAFIGQMIEESRNLRSKIRIYTTMVGQKTSLTPLKATLLKENIPHIQTEFCQGHTTRWGLAWTFNDALSLEKSLPEPIKRKKIKKKPPLKYIVPKDCDLPAYTVTAVSEKVKAFLLDLKMECEEVSNDKHETSYCATAYSNTWSNQRRKRRCRSTSRPAESPDLSMPIKIDRQIEHSSIESLKRAFEVSESSAQGKEKQIKIEENNSRILHYDKIATSQMEGKQPILKSQVLMRKISSEVNIQISWLDGSLGRDACHQLLQYLKNKLHCKQKETNKNETQC